MIDPAIGANDLIVQVPPGTVSLTCTGELLADLTEPGQRVTVGAGGRGGRGNTEFKSSINEIARTAERGEPGQE